MPIFVDPKTGEQFANVPDEDQDRARKEFGLVSPEEYEHSKAVEQAGEGTSLQSIGQGFQRGIGARAEAIQDLTGFGTAPGLDEDEKGNKLPGGGLTALQDAYSPEAKLVREAHPNLASVGTGASFLGESALGGAALGAALPGVAALGTSAGAVVGDALPQAIGQEYDDAWLEARPVELKNVAANTLMFAGGDFLFRGVLHGLGAGLNGLKQTKGMLGGRNVVSEAQGAAREILQPGEHGAQSVGAASAADMAEPFDNAIKQMSDKSAGVLARDADDHIHLVSQDASEAFTRLNEGISESLGTNLKHEDIAHYAAELDEKTLERQQKWLSGMAEQGDVAAREIAQFTEGDKGALDFGNLGKRAVKTIDDFNHRIANEPDAGARNILTDEYKKRLDALTIGIDAAHTVDNVTRKELKGLIAPVREGLRKGLENAKYFGGAADLQRALNPGWHQFLEHWPRVQQQVLEATGHVKFDVGGAGRITKESTIDRMLSLFSKDPRANQDFGKHLAGAFDGLQQLIEAREANGIVRKEGLEAMQGDVRNLMEDWNLAATVGVAKNRVAAMKKDPRQWSKFALDFAEGAPVVGGPIRALRNIGEAMTDLHLPHDEAVGKVWDAAYKRYALNPAFEDPAIIRNYPDWVAEAITNRGGRVPPVPPGGAANDIAGGPGIASTTGNSAIDRARARASQGGSVGISGPKLEPKMQAVVNAFSGAKEPMTKAHIGEAMGIRHVPEYEVDELVKQGVLRKAERRPGWGVEQRWELAPKDLPKGTSILDQLRSKTAAMKAAPGKEAEFAEAQAMVNRAKSAPVSAKSWVKKGKDVNDALSASDAKALKTYSEQGYRGVNSHLRGAPDPRNPEYFAQLAKDVSRVLDEQVAAGRVTPGTVYRQVDNARYANLKPGSEFSDPAVLSTSQHEMGARSLERVEKPLLLELEQQTGVPNLRKSATGRVNDEREVLIRPGTKFRVVSESERNVFGQPTRVLRLREEIMPAKAKRPPASLAEAMAEGEELGFGAGSDGERELLEGYANGNLIQQGGADAERSLSEASRARVGKGGQRGMVEVGNGPNFSLGDVAKSPMGVVTGLGAAGLGLNAAMADRPPPPAQTPDARYRDALKEINKAGQREVQSLVTEALRKKPSRGKDKSPIALFAGKQSIQDAVEATRERLDEIAGDPTSLVQQLLNNSGDISKTHPAVYSALVEKAAQIAGYLQSSLPPKTATTLLDPRGGALSFDRSWDYAARFIGATQPRAARREVARGNAPPEMIEALSQNWPEVWDGFRVEMLGQVQRMSAAGRHIPSEKLRRLDSLLGMGGQLDPSATLDVAKHFLAAQDAEMQKRQQTGQQKGPMPSSAGGGAAFRTKLEEVNQENL